MKLKLTDAVKSVIQSAVVLLKGAARRAFMASVVGQMGRGGQRLASVELGWNRGVVRKGLPASSSSQRADIVPQAFGDGVLSA